MEAIKKLHACLITSGLHHCQYAMSKVFGFYSLSPPNLVLAGQVFEQIEAPRTYHWNIMIRGLAQSNAPEDAIGFFKRARENGLEPDNMTFPFVLKACAKINALREGKRIHTDVLKLGFLQDIFISNSLIHLYAVCGDLCCARSVFDEMPVKDVISWNSLICGYSQCNRVREVLSLFKLMQDGELKADKITMVKVLSACTHLGDWNMADCMVKYIEDNCIELNVYLGNTMIDYYGRRGLVKSAVDVFAKMKDRNIVTSNIMITTYARGGDLLSARKIFDQMPCKDVISWSSMISGYSQASHFSDALELFRQMQRSKVKPDEVVIVSVLSACAHLGALHLGRWIHEHVRRSNITADIYVGNSLIDMYAKCGCTTEAFRVFKEMEVKDTLSWNSIILGLANNSFAEDALKLFHAMLTEGFRPNDVTFLGVLIACANQQLVEEGLKYFESMRLVHNLEPQMKHYGCVVDLLSRSGQLDKAFRFITQMPLAPGPVVWRILLAACKLHGNVVLAEVVTKKLNELDPGNSGNNTLLSNTYASADRWCDAVNARQLMAISDVRKSPGCSLLDAPSSRSKFMAGKAAVR